MLHSQTRQFIDPTSRRLKRATDRWSGLRMDRGAAMEASGQGGFWPEREGIIDTPSSEIKLI